MGQDTSNETASDSAGRRGDVSRRRLLTTGAAAWSTVSLAGCNYITDPGTPSGNGGSGGSGGDGDQDDVGDGDQDDSGTGGTGGTGGNTTVTNETTTTDDTSTPSGGTSTGTPCQSSRQFFPGMEIGLQVNVFDSETGDYLGDESLQSVTVEFPNADYGPLEMNWKGPHEEFSEEGWGAKIETAEDIEPGTYRYEIHVQTDDDSEPETVTDQFTIV